MQRRQSPHAVWNSSYFANWYDSQLSENQFHWEHVKHRVIRQAFINDVRIAGQEPLCAKHLKLEQLDIFRPIQHNLAPDGSLSYSHSTDTNAQSWGLIINRFALDQPNRNPKPDLHPSLQLQQQVIIKKEEK
jgi:hypothetical protein